MRTLTYVTLDDGNGGIVRNLNHEGLAVQAVARLHPEQRVRMRFELRFPRLRVDVYGQVSWANEAGQCGIRFVELPVELRRRIDEWIFSSLLESLAHNSENDRAADRANGRISSYATMFDGTIFDATIPYSTIANVSERASASETSQHVSACSPGSIVEMDESFEQTYGNLRQLECEGSVREFLRALSLRVPRFPQSLSPRAKAWLVDGLVVIAALLLFALIFLCVVEEVPRWRLSLSAGIAALVFVVGSYWSLFLVFGGASLGTRLVQITSTRKETNSDPEESFR